MCVACRMNGTSERERERKIRNIATPTPQFKMKHVFERREFARVVYANFFDACKSAKPKMQHAGQRSSVAEAVKGRCDFYWLRWIAEMLFFVSYC